VENTNEAKNLERERIARAIEIMTTTGASCRWWDSVHGVEPGPWSRFWVTGVDDVESEEEAVKEDNTSTSVLIREAMDAGFSIEQLQQAAEELASSKSSSKQVKSSSQLSLSNQIVDVWLENQKMKGNPWPLPKPRKSLMCTFGDVLDVALKNWFVADNDSMLEALERDQVQFPDSLDRSWRWPSPAGSSGRHEFQI
jgi:nitrogen regulatory protein PII-like uncharacterized protein